MFVRRQWRKTDCALAGVLVAVVSAVSGARAQEMRPKSSVMGALDLGGLSSTTMDAAGLFGADLAFRFGWLRVGVVSHIASNGDDKVGMVGATLGVGGPVRIVDFAADVGLDVVGGWDHYFEIGSTRKTDNYFGGGCDAYGGFDHDSAVVGGRFTVQRPARPGARLLLGGALFYTWDLQRWHVVADDSVRCGGTFPFGTPTREARHVDSIIGGHTFGVVFRIGLDIGIAER